MEYGNHVYTHICIYMNHLRYSGILMSFNRLVTMAATAVALVWMPAQKTRCIRTNDGPACIVRPLLTAMITSISFVSSACSCSNSPSMARINEEARFSLNEQTGDNSVSARQLHAGCISWPATLGLLQQLQIECL